jgi:signal transduction histidine kinase
VFVKGEAVRLRQVLANFLGNALKFTPTGGHVAVRLETRDGTASVVVQDDGRGMDAKDLQRLFRPFVRIDSDQPKKPGSGLGLYLSKRIIEAHGGQVGATSPGPGKGMEFRFGVPISVPARNRASEGDNAGRSRTRPLGGPARTHGRKGSKSPDPVDSAVPEPQGNHGAGPMDGA